MPRIGNGVAALLACCASVGALAACGDDDSGSGASTPPAGTATKADSGVAGPSVDVALRYTGGKAAAAESGAEPVVLGLVVQKGGTPDFGSMEVGATAGAELINKNLGGLGGRPISLETCVIQAEEDGQKCAAQFLGNPKMVAVVYALTVVGNKTFHDAVAGKLPIIVSFPGNGADYTTKGVYELDGGGDASLKGIALDAKRGGASSVAVLSSNNPAGKFATDHVLVPALKQQGIDTKPVYVDDTATTPDYASALQAAGAAKADAVILIPASTGACVSLYDAMKQLNISKKVIGTFLCIGDPMPEHTGGGPKGWDILNSVTNPRIDDDETLLYKDAMNVYGDGGKSTFVGAPSAPFGVMLTLAKFGNALGADGITKQGIVQQLEAFRGPMFMVPGAIRCGHHPTYVGICGDSASGSSYDGSKWVDLGAFKVTALKP